VTDTKPDALLLDEMFSPAIAADLSARDIDCRAVVSDPLLRAQEDLAILEAALVEGRVLVTNNVPDFESLRRAWDAAGRTIPGLIYTHDASFPTTKSFVPRLSDALKTAARTHETGRRGGVLWLQQLRGGAGDERDGGFSPLGDGGIEGG
jgi:hypothetical protein